MCSTSGLIKNPQMQHFAVLNCRRDCYMAYRLMVYFCHAVKQVFCYYKEVCGYLCHHLEKGSYFDSFSDVELHSGANILQLYRCPL